MEMWASDARDYATSWAGNVLTWLDAIRSDDADQAMASIRTMESHLRQMRELTEEGQ